jgi:hypothetical protein
MLSLVSEPTCTRFLRTNDSTQASSGRNEQELIGSVRKHTYNPSRSVPARVFGSLVNLKRVRSPAASRAGLHVFHRSCGRSADELA